MARSFALATFTVFATFASLPAQDGRLNEVRAATQVRPTARSDSAAVSPAPAPYTADPADDQLEDSLSAGFGTLIFGALAAPYVVPRLIVHDRNEDLYFPRHPYDRGYHGYLAPPALASPALAEKWGPDNAPTWWMGRISFENGNDFNGLNRFQGQFLFDTTSRFGLVTNWDHFDERLARGRGDQTTIGDVTLLYRFAQSERFLMRSGVGFRTLTDDRLTEWGFNFHYSAEWFPREPLILTGSVDLGSLGSAFVVRTRATAGVIWRGWEAFGGYDLLRIGDVNLHGPMIGVRYWF